MKRLVPLVVACGILACTKKADPAAPWLTTPDLTTHSALFFPINSGDVHGPAAGQQLTTCNQCHADRSSGAAPYPPSSSFKTYTCTGCHVAVGGTTVYHDDIAGLAALPEHVGQAGFDPTQPLAFDQACRNCHPDGSGVPKYHAQLFPIDSASSHAGIGCSACHGTDRANLTQLQCASCHADSTKSTNFPTRHNPVGSVAILVQTNPPASAGAGCTTTALPTPANPVAPTDDPRSCLKCHALSAPIPVSAHPTGNSAFGTGPHQGAGCFTCHVATTQVTATVPAPTPAPSGYQAVDFTQPNPASQSSPGCATCHANGCGGNGL